ncbi:MAG: lactate utilization protein C, partial [Acetobacteraceae bacterium]
MSSRTAILTAIRRGLRRGELAPDIAETLRARMREHPRHLIPARSRVPHAEQIALFIANLEREFGTVARVPSAEAVPEAVASYLAGQNLPSTLVMAPHPELRAIDWASRPMLAMREGR